MIGNQKQEYRRFEYIPQFYDPEKDEKEEKRFRFRRNFAIEKARSKQSSLVWLLALLGFAYYLIKVLDKISK